MAHLQAQDYNAKRERIKVSAAAIFAKKGYYGTSIIDIAKACRTVKSRLYYYFPSKAQLFYEILKDHAEYLAAHLLPIFTDINLDAREQLDNYAYLLLRINIEYRHQHALILHELGTLDAQQSREINMLLRRTVEALYPALLSLNPKLNKKRHLLLPTAIMFIGMINWLHTCYDGRSDLQIKEYAQHLCDTFLDGYSA